MPLYLNTQGNSSLGIGICDRCAKKFPIGELHEDRNTPGLLVCEKDNDDFDPWRLPARQPDRITLPHYRPDVDIAVYPPGEGPTVPGTDFRLTEGDDYRDIEDDDYRITEVNP
jgi:hypothetical protein